MKILLIIGFVIFGHELAYGQFDPNCYYPIIGLDIDTVYGSKNEQLLGDNIVNLGQLKGDSYGTIGVYGLPGHLGKFSTFSSGPDFDIHQLKNVKEFPLELGGSKYWSYQFGHFRDREHLDLFTFNGVGRIFWADNEGNYDTSRYTILRSDLPNLQPSSFIGYDRLTPYVTNLTSDSLEDIVMMCYRSTLDHRDTMYLLLFKGGENLFSAGQKAYQDSIYNIGYYDPRIRDLTRGGFYADYRGTGRNDAVLEDDSINMFFYKNDPPFSMKKFVDAIEFDTLFSRYENPKATRTSFFEYLTMQAFRRHDTSDKSVDFLYMFESTDPETDLSLWIFKGGPEFGSKRLYMDKPDAFLWHPKHYDSGWNGTFFFDILRDCGDMTGTGNRVLSAYGAPFAGGTGFSSFYVLGDALDDKVDMFYTSENFVGIPDTITADGDNLQDIILGDPIALSDKDDTKGWNNVGAIGLLKGTKKIPVKLNEVFATEEREHLKTTQMYAHPNPLDQKTTLTFENCTSGVMYMEVVSSIGVSVLREEIPDVDGLQQYAADLSALPAGAYHIRLVCPADGWSAGTNVIKTGAVVTPWSLDLRKVVGR